MNVFLLEDDDAIGMGLKYSLEKEGFTVTHAKSLAQAREDFKKNKFSICIIDINLPDGSGYDACKYIKEREDVPVIFLTALEYRLLLTFMNIKVSLKCRQGHNH